MSKPRDIDLERLKRSLLSYRGRGGDFDDAASDAPPPPAVVRPMSPNIDTDPEQGAMYGRGEGGATLAPIDDKARQRAMQMLREELALERSEMRRHRSR